MKKVIAVGQIKPGRKTIEMRAVIAETKRRFPETVDHDLTRKQRIEDEGAAR